MKTSTTTTSAKSLSIPLLVLTIMSCLQLALLVMTTPSVRAAPSFDTSTKKVDRLTRGGGGGGHGSGSGAHDGSGTGGHTAGSETGASSGDSEEESNAGSYHNNNGTSAYHSNNGSRELASSNSPPYQDNPSTLQILWSFFLMCIGVAIIIYFIRRRTQQKL